jgi:hypothetical protein
MLTDKIVNFQDLVEYQPKKTKRDEERVKDQVRKFPQKLP